LFGFWGLDFGISANGGIGDLDLGISANGRFWDFRLAAGFGTLIVPRK
jgi:hypothetical protein